MQVSSNALSSVDSAWRYNEKRCKTFRVGEIIRVHFNKTTTYLAGIVGIRPKVGVVEVVIMDEKFGSNASIVVNVGSCEKLN